MKNIEDSTVPIILKNKLYSEWKLKDEKLYPIESKKYVILHQQELLNRLIPENEDEEEFLRIEGGKVPCKTVFKRLYKSGYIKLCPDLCEVLVKIASNPLDIDFNTARKLRIQAGIQSFDSYTDWEFWAVMQTLDKNKFLTVDSLMWLSDSFLKHHREKFIDNFFRFIDNYYKVMD